MDTTNEYNPLIPRKAHMHTFDSKLILSKKNAWNLTVFPVR